MALNAVFGTTTDNFFMIGLEGGNNPRIIPQVPTEKDLQNAHTRLTELEKPLFLKLGGIFVDCKAILTMVINDTFKNLSKDGLRDKCKILKKIGKEIKKGKPIPKEIVELYKTNRVALQNNLISFINSKKAGYGEKMIGILPLDPKDGLELLCKKASQALFWGVV